MKLEVTAKKKTQHEKLMTLKARGKMQCVCSFLKHKKLCSCYYYLHAQFHSLDHQLVDYLLSQILEKKNTFNPYIHELHN